MYKGEFGLIEQIRRQFADIPAGEMTGIGDDCAVLPLDGGRSMVVTTDLLIENIHFLRDKITPFDLGYKSLAVNLSDVAAMGASPLGSFLSVALPVGVSEAWVDAFLEGYHALSVRYGVPLLGGDTTASSGDFSISVTALGTAQAENLKKRCGAREGDIIFVTGELGGSAQGLVDLMGGHISSPFIAQHHRPEPAVLEGQWLGKQPGVHAMMDLSDGLISDLPHILDASGLGAEVELEVIPTKTSVRLAVIGGEDYQLLGTADAESFPEMEQAYRAAFNKSLHPIGTVRAGNPEVVWLENGVQTAPDWKGFSHF